MGEQTERLIVLRESFKTGRIINVELCLDGKRYGAIEWIQRMDRPPWLEEADTILDLIFPTNDLTRDMEEKLARMGGEIPLVSIKAYENGNCLWTVDNASITSWSANTATIVGGRLTTIAVERSTIIPVVVSDEQLRLQMAREIVKKMKIKDPTLGRFEIELED